MSMIRFRFIVLGALVGLIIPLAAQNAVHLDGVNDYIQTPFPGIQGNSARTVEAWIKTTANCNPNNGGVQQIITDWGVQATGSRFTFNVLWNDAIRLEVSGSGLSGFIPVNDGAWHHVAVVYDPSVPNPISLYVDGVLDVAGSISTPVNTASGNMRIGQRVDGARHFDGTIEEVRVWNYARTPAELGNAQSIELCTPSQGLLAYYPFNQGVAGGNNLGANTVLDQSGNAYDGLMFNVALMGSTSNWVSGLPLTPGASSTGFLTETACADYLSPSGNYVWTTSGTYLDTIPNAIGCDSLLTVNLTINRPEDSITVSACEDYLSPSGSQLWTTSGLYQDTITTSQGCDSIVKVNLTIIQSTAASMQQTACGAYVSPSGNFTWTSSGIYQDTLLNAAGCDSVITIELSLELEVDSIQLQACDSLISPSGNTTWTSSGVYRDTVMGTNGCDTIKIVDLSLNTSQIEEVSQNICGPFTSPSGNYVWSETGIYRDTTTNIHGCAVYHTYDLTRIVVDTMVIATGDSLTANLAGVTYQWLDCEEGFAPVGGATERTFVPTQAGNYALQIDALGCRDTSSCYSVNPATHIRTAFGGVDMFPNPTSGIIHLRGISPATIPQLQLYDSMGRKRRFSQLNSGTEALLDLSTLSTGVYFLHLTIAGNKRLVQKIWVQ